MGNESMGYTELGNMKLNMKPPKKSWDINPDWIKKGGLIAGIAVLVVLMVFGMVKIIGGGGFDSAVDKFAENVMVRMFNGGEIDEAKLKKQYPKFMNETIEEFCDSVKDEYDNAFAGIEDLFDEGEERFKVTYEIVDKEKLDDDEIEEYQDEISSFAGDDEKVNVQAGYLINIEIKARLKSKYKTKIEKEIGEEIEGEDEDNWELVVLKCNGKTGVWKIDDSYIWNLIY